MDARVRRGDLDALLDGYDALDVIAALLLASFAGYPPPAENWARPPAVTAEFAMTRLLRRREPSAPAPTTEPLAVVDLVLALEGALSADRTTASIEAGDDAIAAPFGSVHRRFSDHEVMLYDPAVLEYEMVRLPELFGPFDAELRAAVGLDIGVVLALIDALNRQTFGWMLWEADANESPTSGADLIETLAAAAAGGAGRWVRSGAGTTLAITREGLAHASGASVDEIEAFLDLLAVRPPLDRPDQPFEQRVWRFRQRPVIDWDNRIVMPVPYDVLVAVRPRLEAELRSSDTRASARYEAHRSRWLEAKTRQTLHDLIEPDQHYRDLHVPIEDRSAQREGLLRIDLWLLAVECKAGGVSGSARRGNPESQDTTLERLVHDGVAQAQSTLAAVAAGEEVTGVEFPAGKRRVPVDVGHTVRQLALVVTLEDVGGVSARTQTLFGDAHSEVPLVLSIDDIEWYGTALGSRVLVLHYLRVRQRCGAAELAVLDESDWFRLYLQHGGAGVAEWLEQARSLGRPIFGHAGNARRGMPEPRLVRWSSPLLPVADRWAAAGTDGWIEGSVALLDLAPDYADALPQLIEHAHSEATQASENALLTLRPAGEPTTALHILIPGETGEPIQDQALARWMYARAENAQRHLLAICADGTADGLHFVGALTLAPVDPSSPAQDVDPDASARDP